MRYLFYKKNHFWLLFTLLSVQVPAQSSFFDIDAESWTGAGDPASTIPIYLETGGNPGGYIRINDAATGGLWYFLPPPKFKGNRCDAYGRYMRYDQFTNDTMGQQTFASAWDIMIEGGNGQNLIWDHAVLPGESWTHYDILLKEDAGWRLENSNQAPTEAEFRAILGDIERIRILGEYHVGFDYGGMDNFIFESNYQLDLDEDDSTTERGSWDFWQDSTCHTPIGIVDDDLLLAGDPVFSQIEVSAPPFGFDAAFENLEVLGNVPSTIGVSGDGTDNVILTNLGTATNADFAAALNAVFFQSSNPNPSGAVRIVHIAAKPDCGDGVIQTTAFLPLYPTPPAGVDQTLEFCASDAAVDLRSFFAPDIVRNGYWSPLFASGTSVYDPNLDPEGMYSYITSGAPDCPKDTAIFSLKTVAGFELGADTLLCRDSVLRLFPDLSDYDSWAWENGSNSTSRILFEAGIYSLAAQTGACFFSDSIRLDYTECAECSVYAPNVFSPDVSGLNERFQVFTSCEASNYLLRIYDRWGGLVFENQDPKTAWFGVYKGKKVTPGIYLWQLSFETEVFGEKTLIEKSGDILLLR